MLKFHKGFSIEEEKKRRNPEIKTVEEIRRENPSLNPFFKQPKIQIEGDSSKQNTFRNSTSFEKINGFRNIKK